VDARNHFSLLVMHLHHTCDSLACARSNCQPNSLLALCNCLHDICNSRELESSSIQWNRYKRVLKGNRVCLKYCFCLNGRFTKENECRRL
jgi:hypothetical protein